MFYPKMNQEIKTISVGEFTTLIKKAISNISPVWIEGEVSDFKNWRDRWIFFSLKDEFALLKCNLSKYKLDSFGFGIEDGMQVRILGQAELRKKGEFTFNVEMIECQGEGSLKKAYELLKKKLQTEGLFARKRKIPDFVKNIGLISSKSGVVSQDFLKNLKPFGFKVYFHDARVEGAKAVPTIISAIRWFNKNMPQLEVLVIARGGGSLESLMAFNNEILAREIFASNIPIICGIGHEVDVPIASLVADAAVSTPTAAAIYLLQPWETLQKQLPFLKNRLLEAFKKKLDLHFDEINKLKQEIIMDFEKLEKEKKAAISILFEKITSNFQRVFYYFQHMEKRLKNNFNNLEISEERVKKQINTAKENLLYSLESAMGKIKNSLLNYERYLSASDPKRNLKLGYSITFDSNNKVINNIAQVKVGNILSTELFQGKYFSKVQKIKK